MSVHVAKEALDVDFRTESTRTDVPGVYRERPGFHLSQQLAAARETPTPAIFFNGNNVGYWGNQFAIEGGRLVYKERGPIFDDGALVDHVCGRHFFFCCSADRFAVECFELSSSEMAKGDNAVQVQASSHDLPAAGLSGFPLVHGGEQVWRDHLTMAWDPRLVFEVGRLTGVDRRDVLREIRDRSAAKECLARHSMTLVGVDGDGRPVLVVVEQSTRSQGISLAGAAELMTRLDVPDAVALGAAGDAQLATTDEGFLTAPLVADHVRAASREVPRRLRSRDLDAMEVVVRPVPCMVSVDRCAGMTTRPMSVDEVTTATDVLAPQGGPAVTG